MINDFRNKLIRTKESQHLWEPLPISIAGLTYNFAPQASAYFACVPPVSGIPVEDYTHWEVCIWRAMEGRSKLYMLPLSRLSGVRVDVSRAILRTETVQELYMFLLSLEKKRG